MNVVFLTTGTPRKVKVGGGHGILFKHSSSGKNFDYRSELMMLIVSAMREIGQNKLTEEERSRILSLASKVSRTEFNHDIQLAPAWVRTILMSR